jgi:hypothetical protein
MTYQQAQIPVQKTEQFEQLRSAVERVFAAAVEKFYAKLESKSVAVRDLATVLDRGILEKVDSVLAQQKKAAKQLYEELALSDQALMREYYLERIEQVDPAIRYKYRSIYRYY